MFPELDEIKSVHSFPKLVGNWGKSVYKVLCHKNSVVRFVVTVCNTTACTDRQSGCHCVLTFTKTMGFLL